MITTVLAIALQVAATAQMTVSDGEEVTLPVAPAGLTVQLPDYVRVVTPSPEYAVKPLIPPRPPPRNGDPAAAAAAEKTDVRVFLIRPLRADAAPQQVTFVLADSRSVSLTLLPGTARDDSFVDLRWPKRSGASARGRGGEQFLAGERTLLVAMMRDEPVSQRKIVDRKVELPAYPELEVKLLRTYETPEGLVGGVYTFTNRSKKTVVVNQAVLAVGTPNRAILTQMDHTELRSCKEDASPDPRGTGCMSVVRIVSRADRPDGLPAGAPGAAMPFVLTPKEKP
jgi:hypothetical protein